MKSESTLTLIKGIDMKKKQLWIDLSDEHCEKLVGGHPPGGNEFPAFGTDPPLTGFGNANDDGVAGIFQGFVVRSPTCAIHGITAGTGVNDHG